MAADEYQYQVEKIALVSKTVFYSKFPQNKERREERVRMHYKAKSDRTLTIAKNKQLLLLLINVLSRD